MDGQAYFAGVRIFGLGKGYWREIGMQYGGVYFTATWSGCFEIYSIVVPSEPFWLIAMLKL